MCGQVYTAYYTLNLPFCTSVDEQTSWESPHGGCLPATIWFGQQCGQAQTGWGVHWTIFSFFSGQTGKLRLSVLLHLNRMEYEQMSLCIFTILVLKRIHEILIILSLLISWLNVADAGEASHRGPNGWQSHPGKMPGPLSPIMEKSCPSKFSPLGL